MCFNKEFEREEPEIKEQAETVLDQLGIPLSNAINDLLDSE